MSNQGSYQSFAEGESYDQGRRNDTSQEPTD